MRIIEKSIPVYTFEELSDSAKESAKNDYLSCNCRNMVFQDMMEYQINIDFPNSDLEFQYSLCYCQGDGVNIFGKLSYLDMMEKLKNKFTEKEIKTLNFCFLTFYGWTPYGRFANEDFGFVLPTNYHYSYCKSEESLYKDTVIDDMEYEGMRNIPYNLLEKFAELANDFIHEYCGHIEEMGYEYLYEISDEEMEEISDSNGWEYLEDGTMF